MPCRCHHVRLTEMVGWRHPHDEFQGNRQFTSIINSAAQNHAHIRWRYHGIPKQSTANLEWRLVIHTSQHNQPAVSGHGHGPTEHTHRTSSNTTPSHRHLRQFNNGNTVYARTLATTHSWTKLWRYSQSTGNSPSTSTSTTSHGIWPQFWAVRPYAHHIMTQCKWENIFKVEHMCHQTLRIAVNQPRNSISHFISFFLSFQFFPLTFH